MPVDKTETVGSRARSYDRSLGIVETRLYMCALDDAEALLLEYSHNVLDTEVGLYFNRYRSSIQRGQCYATCSLVFTGNPDITLTGGSNAVHADGDTEYDFDASAQERPLEMFENYRNCWNYVLWAKKGITAVPAWWTTSTDLTTADGESYRWEKRETPVPDGWYRLKDVYYGNTAAGNYVDFRGVEAGEYQYVTVNVVKYYRDRDDAMAQIVKTNRLIAPPYVGEYESGNRYWRITNSRVYLAGKYWVCSTTYKYADRGWNTAIYYLET